MHPAGARLPSVRQLMAELGVSPVTVQRALDRLSQEGVIETRPGQGTFTAAKPAAPPPQAADLSWQSAALGPSRAIPGVLSSIAVPAPPHARRLNAGYLPESLQATALLERAAAQALRRPGIWHWMPPEGNEALRAWFAAVSQGAFAAHEITICPGTQAAIAAIFLALASPGDPVLVESPTYAGAIAAANAAGVVLIPVATDQHGVRPESLADAFRRTSARLFYAQPNCLNPTGAALAEPRRAAVLDAASRAGAFVIEDDWAHDFWLDGASPPTLAALDRNGHVIALRSFTKSAAPGLRVGALCAKGAALQRLRAARLITDFFVPGIMQETALNLVTSAAWPRHLRALQAELRHRRDLLATALAARFGESALLVPSAGLHLWLQLPDTVSDTEIEAEAASRGILVSAGRHWFPAEPTGAYLRLSFAAAGHAWISDTVAELAAIVEARAGRDGVSSRVCSETL